MPDYLTPSRTVTPLHCGGPPTGWSGRSSEENIGPGTAAAERKTLSSILLVALFSSSLAN